MRILDKYILKRFLFTFFLAILVFLTIFHVVDVIENIDRFLKNSMTLQEVGLYYLYQLPFFIDISLPMSMLLASVFTIGILSKNNELTAIKALGISLYRVSAPLLLLSFLISIGAFFFNDYFVIPYSRKQTELEKEEMHRHKKYQKQIFRNVFLQDNPNRNIVIGKYYLTRKMGRRVSIQITENKRLKKRIDASRIKWLENQKKWQISDFIVRNFADSNHVKMSNSRQDTVIALNLKPKDFAEKNIKPEDMRFKELHSFISRLKATGNKPTRWQVKLNYKIAFPFTNLIVVLFGLPITALFTRNSISYGAGLSLLVIFTYYGFIKFGEVLGYKGIISPFLSAWLGNIIFLVLGGIFFIKIRQ